jgi:two-component system, LytTR family, sensor kinase
MNILLNNYKRILLHTTFWLALLLLLNIEFLENTVRINLTERILIYLYVVVSFAIATYINLYFLMPKWLFKKQYKLYALSLFALVSLVAFLNNELLHFVFNTEKMFGERLSTLLFFTFFTMGIKILRTDLNKNRRINELERIQSQQELQLLKSQINPHFLFNTLNSLYALTLTDSKKASEVTLKLSDLMRYMFTTAQNSSISLAKEIDYITNYINLEQLRLNKEAHIAFNKKGDFTTKNIAPMLFLPFVENAFKHGVETQSQNISVEIDVALQEDDLFFQIKNSKPQYSQVDKTGIGLMNIQKRLQLLYPDKHELSISDEKDTFFLKLWIKV